jgi:hypothetical protein
VGSDNFALYGQEVNGATWALARMNMFLHAKDAARIEWCDTLNNPTLIEGDHLMRFDIVLANPPFSLDKWGAENASSDPFNPHFSYRPVAPRPSFRIQTELRRSPASHQPNRRIPAKHRPGRNLSGLGGVGMPTMPCPVRVSRSRGAIGHAPGQTRPATGKPTPWRS